jgi:hypothetical protein
MRKSATILFTVGLIVSGYLGPALAAGGGHGVGGGGGGGGGGGHFSGSGGNYSNRGGYFGGGGRNSGSSNVQFSGGGRIGRYGGGGYGYGLGFGLGLGTLYDGYPYWGGYWPYDYYDPYDYYPDLLSPYPNPNPLDLNGPDAASASPASGRSWYHCDSPEGYYPYVKTCSHAWQPVPAVPPPPPPDGDH